ncbi:MAG: BBE domain-containing protein [Actinomycetota bacterium]
MRSLGLTVDNVLSVDLVTAEGQTLHVDAETEPELFWGLRGGGGNFGIVTAFEYRLHRVGPIVLGGPIFWPLEQAGDVLGFVRAFAPEMPDKLGLALTTRLAPPVPFLPPDWYGNPVLGLVLLWSGDLGEGEKAIAPLRRLRRSVADAVRPVPYLSIQTMLDGGNPHGMHYYWRSQRLADLSGDVIDVILGLTERIRSPLSYLAGFTVGGAVSRVDASETAVGERAVGFEINVVAAWRPVDPSGEQHTAWVRDGSEGLRPHSTGVFSHFLSDEGAAGIEAAYGKRLGRLTRLKDRYDRTNFFSMNANIPPS